jgi:hypothetical protein
LLRPKSYACLMTFEESRDLLHAHLRKRWGDEPGWEFRRNHDYGYYLMFRFDLVDLGEVRKLIENLFGFGNYPTFILGDLRPR